jgi:hypothetical protein
MTNEPKPLTDAELDAAFRKDATNEEITVKLRDLHYWTYVMRDPFGAVAAVGRGTRADCIKNAFELADEHAIENFSCLDDPADEVRAVNGSWSLTLWPPKLDPDPPFWSVDDIESD